MRQAEHRLRQNNELHFPKRILYLFIIYILHNIRYFILKLNTKTSFLISLNPIMIILNN